MCFPNTYQNQRTSEAVSSLETSIDLGSCEHVSKNLVLLLDNMFQNGVLADS